MNKYLYHLTNKSNVQSILQNGLKPQIGDNAALVNEKEPYVYLCELKDIPYWRIILGCDAVLKIRIDAIDQKSLNIFNYSSYKELLYEKSIPADAISKTRMPKYDSTAMRELCLDYIETLNSITRHCATHYTYDELINDAEDTKILSASLNSAIVLMDKLDYSVLTSDEVKQHLRLVGNSGITTFVDEYRDSGKKLYQQLLLYPKDEMSKDRRRINTYIKKTFPFCLRMNTGGWDI